MAHYPSVDNQTVIGTYTDRPNETMGALHRSTHHEMMDQKLDESRERESAWTGGEMAESLRSNIARKGIKDPVYIHETVKGVRPPGWAKGWLGNGGHRVAVANDIDPEMMVPVNKTISSFGATRRDGLVDYSGWMDSQVRNRHSSKEYGSENYSTAEEDWDWDTD